MANQDSNNFWQRLPKPIIGLAPMDGITDYAFREIVSRHGKPDVMYTEFVNVEGLCHNAPQMLRAFYYSKNQRPIVAQLFGKDPGSFYEATMLVCELGFDGVDINMGCPAKNVAGHGSGAALIDKPDLALEIIISVKAAIDDYLNGKTLDDCPHLSSKVKARVQAIKKRFKLSKIKMQIPVSIKTRLGVNENQIVRWIQNLLKVKLACIAIHGRTLKQGYQGQADWLSIKEAVLTRDNTQDDLYSEERTLILGNGDLLSLKKALDTVKIYLVDGALIGRASLGNPQIFAKNSHGLANEVSQNLNMAQVALEHAQIFEEIYSQEEQYKFWPMRKHLASYIKGFPDASRIRAELVQTNSSAEVAKILKAHGLL